MNSSDINAAFSEIKALTEILKRQQIELDRREKQILVKESAFAAAGEKSSRLEKDEKRLADSVLTLRAEKRHYREKTEILNAENQNLLKQIDRLKRENANLKDRNEIGNKSLPEVKPDIVKKPKNRIKPIKKDSQTELSCSMMGILGEVFEENFEGKSERTSDWLITLANRIARIWRDDPKVNFFVNLF